MPPPQPTTPAQPTGYLDPHTLMAVGSLELRARLIVEGLLAGMHRSPFQGSSLEFAQHRPYTPGDDLRHLDWKVFGRSDKLYIKQYQKETNLDLVVLVDVSGSMAFGSTQTPPPNPTPWTKYDLGASLAAAFAYLALRQQDRVGLALFADTVLTTTRMSSAQDHWQSLVDTLVSQSAQLIGETQPHTAQGRPTDLERIFQQVLAKLTQRSLIVLISDLFDDIEALERGLARVRFSGHDLIMMQILDPAERAFPWRKPVRFLGLEGERMIGLDPLALREAYLAQLREHLRHIEQAGRRFRFDHLLLDSSQPLRAPLMRFLAYRATVARKGR